MDRISEIELTSVRPLQYRIYLSNQRVAINSTLPWSSSLLNRLGSLLFPRGTKRNQLAQGRVINQVPILKVN